MRKRADLYKYNLCKFCYILMILLGSSAILCYPIYAVTSTQTVLNNSVSSEYLNLSSNLNTTRYIDLYRYSYLKNLSLSFETQNLSMVARYKLDFNTTATNNLTAYDSYGSNHGTISGINYNHAISYLDFSCYQEFANSTTSCGGLGNGTYFHAGSWSGATGAPELSDGNWSSFSIATGGEYQYINYSIPNLAINATWQVKINTTVQNISIPSICFNKSRVLALRIYSHITDDNLQCLNSSFQYTNLSPSNISGGGSASISEEAIFWTYSLDYKLNQSFGYLGKGMNFDGDGDYLNTSNPSLFNFTNQSFTISTWVNLKSISGNKALFVKDDYSHGYYFGVRSGNFELDLYNSGVDGAYAHSGITAALNTWYHVVAVYNGSNAFLYLNGLLKEISSGNVTIANVGHPMIIGMYSKEPADMLNGSLDEILIFNRSLSSTEIMGLYTNYTAGKYPPPELMNENIFYLNGNNYNQTDVFDTHQIGESVEGKGQAMYFDGKDDGITVNANNAINTTPEMSFSAWINLNKITGNQNIVYKADNTVTEGYSFEFQSNHLYAVIGNGSQNNIASVSTFETNKWYNVLFTVNTSKVSIYINGIKDKEQSVNNGVKTHGTRNLGIGFSSVWGNYFNGSIDEVQIFNTSLTAEQVSYLYQNSVDRYYPRDLNISIGNNRQFSREGDYSGKNNLSANITQINNILASGCTCSRCSIVNTDYCRIPIDWYNINYGYLHYELLNASGEYGIDLGTNSFNVPSNTTGLTVNLVDEISGELVYATTTGDMNVSTIGSNLTIDVTSTNFSVYIYPNWATFTLNYVLFASAPNYPERRYTSTLTVSNVTTSRTFSLLNNTEGQIGRIRVVDSFQNIISNVDIKLYKTSDLNTIVEEQNTDASGIATFFINPEEDYHIIATKTGYTQTTVTPIRLSTNDIYTITLGEGTTVTTSYSNGINFNFYPYGQLTNNTNYTFNFTLISDYWDITDCNFSMYDNTSTLITTVSGSFNTTNCNGSITLNTGRNTTLKGIGSYTINGTTISQNRIWSVQLYSYQTVGTIQAVIDDITNLAGSGFDDKSRFLLAFICILAFTGYISIKSNALVTPEYAIIACWLGVTVFSYIGWLTMTAIGFPTSVGIWTISPPINQYAIWLITTVLGIGFLAQRFQ